MAKLLLKHTRLVGRLESTIDTRVTPFYFHGDSHPYKQAKTSLQWEDAADGLGGTVRAFGMRAVLITDQVIWNQWKSDPASMPVYLLQFISTNKEEESHEMQLYSPPVLDGSASTHRMSCVFDVKFKTKHTILKITDFQTPIP